MKRWVILLLTTSLSGCGTYLPQLTSPEILPLEVLVAQIDCEFQQAVWKQKSLRGPTALAGWQGVYTVTLKSNESGSAKSLNNTFPFFPAKSVSGTGIIGAGETTTANRTALMKFSLQFDDVKRVPVCTKIQTATLHPFITGRIGFAEWMDRAFHAGDVGGQLQLGRPQRISSIGHTFEFSIFVNANAGAGFIIGPVPVSGVNAAGTIERLDDGIVDVVIAKPAVDPLPGLITELTKAERDLIAKLEELIDQRKDDNSKRTAEINSLTSALGARLSNLNTATIKSLSPSNKAQMETFRVTEPEIEQLKALTDAREAKTANDQKILEYKGQIANIERPKVTTKYRVLPPDRNPEIIYTNQQLTLERLNNNLRVIP
ncbi:MULTISPECIES: hypothetical protein [Bradyrhizobium]|jgi:hypothetical protein|uniref:hypothetical protein n=1 Tax=Bradyrhizobium TaxID=374 RepID=UPI00047FAB14|nr:MULTISPECIES: hypothetical protein [Bradyrhizobium]MCS3452666.1 hypothetical protein [Bradyrhizobium elkanii]MCS3565230.1 hypothetical protein [Bradyrhizobium elkanii]MCW2144942.1 hypothetical protein [Bradyrhizobium elkanii]MCW2356242.1 hypothetical protein [Bradyrhizobium elkanii]MCW2377768.1 hypothetical protein [Bradyrhizobium elkanii]